MRGTFRVSLRTIKNRPRTSPGSNQALYLFSTVRSLGTDGHDITSGERPLRRYNPYWLGGEGTYSQTIIVPDVSSVEESSLLAALPRWSTREDQKGGEAVFLVTPKVAHLFGTDSVFLKKAMTRIFGTDPMPEVFSLVAIVDKIPGKWNVEERRINDCEGFSVMLKPPTPSPFKKHNYPQSDIAPVARIDSSGKAFLEFYSALGYLAGDDSRSTNVVYRVALANTLFVNGRDSTMFYTKWKKSLENLQAKESRYLSIFRFLLRHEPTYMEDSSVPLVPLTEPRTVMTAMGNIVREIQVGDKAVPASTELEAAVMESVKSMSKENPLESQTRIYAFVSGTGVQEDPEFQSSIDRPFTQFVRQLKLGAGLYQVIGGGGGWGHKRGLLALDPAHSSVNTAHSASAIDIDGGFSIKPQNTETALATRGQSVRFYQLQHNLIKARNSHSVHSSPNPVGQDNVSLHVLTRGTGWGLAPPTSDEFKYQHIMIGTIPTTQDVETCPTATGHATANLPQLIEMKGVFGALSETGIEMEINRYPLQKHRPELTPSPKTASKETIVRTISVPHSYLAFKNIGGTPDTAGHLKRSSDPGIRRLTQSES